MTVSGRTGIVLIRQLHWSGGPLNRIDTVAEGELLHPGQDVPQTVVSTQVLSGSDSLQAYARFCQNALYAGAEHPLWAETWLGEKRPEERLITLTFKNGQPAMALALEVRRMGPCSVACFAGGSHAHSNFPPITGEPLEMGDLYGVLHDIRAARPDIDALILRRMRRDFMGAPNPLLHLWHVESANLAFAKSLDRARELNAVASSSRMSRHRRIQRKLKPIAEVRVIQAQTREEVDHLFDHFLQWKGEQLEQRGIANSFGPEEVQTSFRKLFHRALEEEVPSYVLYGLEVGGTLRAVNGYSRSAEGLLCDFLAYRNDELAQFALGEYLTYEVVAQAVQGTDAIYDLGVGEARYKRSWCDLKRQQFEVHVGLSFKGKMLTLATMAAERAKRFIKRNKTANAFLHKAREVLARAKSE